MSETTLPEPSRRSSPSRWLRLGLFAALFTLTILGLGFVWVQRQLAPVSETAAPQPFEVEAGWGAAQVAGALEDAGLVRNARVFGLYLQLQGLDRDLGRGLYTLSPALSTPQLAERLAGGGQPRVVPVVIPEGFRAAQVAARVRAETGVAVRELVQKPGALKPAFVPAGAGLEGYLFPASYEFPVGSSAEAIIRRMLRRFERELTAETRQQLQRLGLDVHEWVTLASMVQAEAGSYEEMPVIAGIFLNRLERGMLLQSDPTVAYGLGKKLPELDAVAGDLDHDTPWNTYTRTGLPRTPIGNPGVHALGVIFAAQRTDAVGEPYLYFLHGLNGEFRPNLTLNDHNRDVAAYLRP